MQLDHAHCMQAIWRPPKQNTGTAAWPTDLQKRTWSNEDISAAISFRKNGVRKPTGYRISREVKG